MEMETLKDLYVEELKDLYSAENQIIKALPKMIKAASHNELKQAFTTHLKETQVHVQRIEQVCDECSLGPARIVAVRFAREPEAFEIDGDHAKTF